MKTFKFIRTVQYTEMVEVQEDNYEDAKQSALEADGERNNDDTIIEIKQVYK